MKHFKVSDRGNVETVSFKQKEFKNGYKKVKRLFIKNRST